MTDIDQIKPDCRVSVREVFGIDSDLSVPAFNEREDHVPEIDDAYRFNVDVTLAILAGYMRDSRVMVQGLHGTGRCGVVSFILPAPKTGFQRAAGHEAF